MDLGSSGDVASRVESHGMRVATASPPSYRRLVVTRTLEVSHWLSLAARVLSPLRTESRSARDRSRRASRTESRHASRSWSFKESGGSGWPEAKVMAGRLSAAFTLLY